MVREKGVVTLELLDWGRISDSEYERLQAEKYCPFDIIYRPKKGFPVPFEKWFHDLNEWDLDSEVFISKDIRGYSGWKKFMLINLDCFIKMFNPFKK